MRNRLLPKWLSMLLSYIFVFTLGAYVYGTTHGNTPELYRWILTCSFGLLFFFDAHFNNNK